MQPSLVVGAAPLVRYRAMFSLAAHQVVVPLLGTLSTCACSNSHWSPRHPANNLVLSADTANEAFDVEHTCLY